MNRISRFKFRKFNESFGEMDIIRTKHTVFPPFFQKYHEKNIYLSDVPYDYLNIYANAEVVLSDRVHACVASLAQDTPAMLFNDSPRNMLFQRVKAENILREPTVLDQTYIESEREKLREELDRIIV